MITDENPKGHPMVAQVAIQQGKALGKNILSLVENKKLNAPFKYKDKGSMATIGKKDAVADLKLVFLNGRLGWLIWSFIHLISITGFIELMMEIAGLQLARLLTNILPLKGAILIGIGPGNNVHSLQYRLLIPKMRKNAQWLGGEGAGSWFVLDFQKKLLRLTWYSPDGIVECDGLYEERLVERIPQ